MKIFVTGASGWIGSAVAQELIEAGHQVLGLARSDAAAEFLKARNIEVRRGDIDDLETLRNAAKESDGVIHLAFKHDIAFSGKFQEAADADRHAVETFAEALAGSNKPLVIASGVLGLTPGHILTEKDGHSSDPTVVINAPGPRARWETSEFVLSLSSRGIRSSIVRLSPTNHGEGDHGFMSTIVAIARDKGMSGYIGDGKNRWPAVHRLDTAHLFRLAVEKAPAGTTLHAVADEGIAIRDIATVIGKHLHIPVASVPAENASEHFTWMANFIGLDSPASSALTQEIMDWRPAQLGLIEDLEQGHYFTQG